MYLIETERMYITEFTPDMAETVHRNSLDADNRRFVPDEVFETVGDAAETIAFLIAQYGKTEGPLVYPAILKTGENIGYVQAVPLDGGVWEIGYHIAMPYTGKGYATEAVTAFLPVVMDLLGLDTIAGVCLADNFASRRVMEKCGFRKCFEGVGPYQGEQRPICRYTFERNR